MPAIALFRLIPLLLLLCVGCKGVAVDSVRDPEADLSKLRTFDWLPTATTEHIAASGSPMVELLGAELQAKGLKMSKEKPDLLVAIHRTIDGTLNTRSSGYEVKSGRIARYTLQEGMLVIDLITAADKQSVWRGTATGAFRADALPEERRALLTTLLHDMLADYPSLH